MGHNDSSHRHDHHHPLDFGRAFAIGITLNTVFIAMEVFFGLKGNSLALLADAGHNFSDVLGLVLAWGATWLSRWHPTDRFTYGFRKSTILAALMNALLLLVAIGGIVWEAISRLMNSASAHGPTIIWVAAAGVVINTATALLFIPGRKTDLNVRGAYLHMAADAAISAGVVVAGILIAITGIAVIDPMISLVVAAIIFAGTWGLLRESLYMAIDAVPENINPEEVARFLSSLPTVRDVHHLHIWGLSTSDIALTAHMILSRPDEGDALLAHLHDELHHRFGISHATIQFELSESGICLTKRCTLHSGSNGKNEGER
jgi:cobalt-zinc-cadmium efflux system protein